MPTVPIVDVVVMNLEHKFNFADRLRILVGMKFYARMKAPTAEKVTPLEGATCEVHIAEVPTMYKAAALMGLLALVAIVSLFAAHAK